MQKLKIAPASAECDGELDLKSPEENDLGNDVYIWENENELGPAVCVTTDRLPPQSGEVQQAEPQLLYNTRNSPGNLGQIAMEPRPQGGNTAVVQSVVLLEKYLNRTEINWENLEHLLLLRSRIRL